MHTNELKYTLKATASQKHKGRGSSSISSTLQIKSRHFFAQGIIQQVRKFKNKKAAANQPVNFIKLGNISSIFFLFLNNPVFIGRIPLSTNHFFPVGHFLSE